TFIDRSAVTLGAPRRGIPPAQPDTHHLLRRRGLPYYLTPGGRRQRIRILLCTAIGLTQVPAIAEPRGMGPEGRDSWGWRGGRRRGDGAEAGRPTPTASAGRGRRRREVSPTDRDRRSLPRRGFQP